MTRDPSHEPESLESAIAVIGMAGRFSGATDVDAYWRNVRAGVESIEHYSDDELLAAGVPRSLLEDPHYVKVGAPLRDMEKFDAGFFGLSPLDASIMDPQHRHFIECAWEAFEHAGHDPARFEGAIGVWGGSGHNAYLPYNLLTNPELVEQVGFFLLRHTGNDKDFLCTRVSYEFDLKGPSVNVQTACSTSLVAIHMACQSLLAGECDMAIAGGATIELPHRHGYLYRDGEILSPDGRCRVFEAGSAGTLFGSGVGVVLLRRLEDALEDGDHVLAVIRGSAINNDGASKVGYLAPSVDGQAQAVAEALAVADVPPDTIRYVECHGTGTAVGDPIEIAALTEAYRHGTDAKRFCAVGSVKPNIGHTDTAAGVASFIKTVQALRHGEIPPCINFEAPNPEIDFESGPFYVSPERGEWPRTPGQPRRAGVNSLGVGGTNAHVILEEAPAIEPSSASRDWQLLLLSARSDNALDAAADRLAEALLRPDAPPLADVAHTLRVGRRRFDRRRAVVCSSAAEAARLLDDQPAAERITGAAGPARRAVTFMFPGGGAQHPRMGRGLYEHEPVYREVVDECLALLEQPFRSELTEVLFPADDRLEWAQAEFERPSLQLPALFITELALARLWMFWGIEPAALIGHSMGENTAACLAGVFRLPDALGLVRLRGRLFEQVDAGTMLSIPLPAAEVEPLLGPELSIASMNAPELCAASGPIAAIEALEAQLCQRKVETRRIKIQIAAHSAMLDPILPEWSAYLEGLVLSPPEIPFVSNLTGTWITPEQATDPQYWVKHLRGTVRFADGVAALLDDPGRVLLEVGPGRTLATLARMHPARTADHAVLNSLRHPDEAIEDVPHVLGVLGRLWIAGVDPDWSAFSAGERRLRVPLPTYPWEHQRHWIAPGKTLYSEGATSGLPRIEEPSDWFHTLDWTRSPAPTPDGEPRRVLAFVGEDPLSAALVDALASAGHEVRRVHAGAGFERRGPFDFAVQPGSAADHARLISTLESEKALEGEIVHLWNVGPAAGATPGARDLDRAFYGLFHLAKALGESDLGEALRVHVISDGMQEVAGEGVAWPHKALLLGPARVMPRELPGVRCRSLDVVLPEPGSPAAAQLVARLVGEITGPADEEVVAWRARERFVARPHTLPLPARDGADVLLREDGVFLITGGLGGLGLVVARYLARARGPRLALLGRSPLPDRQSWDARLQTHGERDPVSRRIRAVRELEALGAEVLVVPADVTDAESVRDALGRVRERFGALHGVVHAAGVLDDEPIALKTPEAAARVLAPKVQGALALDAALGDAPLDFFWLYSSVSATAGLPGQIDYTAANAFLDAFARHRSARGKPTLSIAWGPWQEAGMAAELAREAGAASEPLVEELGHPLVQRRIHETAAEQVFSSTFATGTHWLLDEHRLAEGEALIPGTGFLEIARTALAMRPEPRAVELRDVFLMHPFVVADDAERELRVVLERPSGDFVMVSRREGGDEGQWTEHVRGTAVFVEADSPVKSSIEDLRARCDQRTERFDGPPRPPHLRFGPRWGCLREVRFGHDEALATLELSEAFAADLDVFHAHPAVLDLATGAAHSLIEGFDASEDFYVPMSYARILLHGPLPRRLLSHLRYRRDASGEQDFAIFDVTLLDPDGVECGIIEEFMLKRVGGGQRLTGPEAVDAEPSSVVMFDDPAAVAAAQRNPLFENLKDAIRPAEAPAIFDRLLGHGLDGHVAVLPHALEDWIARLVVPAEPAGGVARAEDPALRADLEESAAAVRGCEGIAEAVVTAHFDRPGERRLLAHIVWADGHHGTVSELRKTLRRALPSDLVPQNFVELDGLPRRRDGEVDRSALEDPFGLADDYVAPRSETEKAVAKIWQEILGVDRVGLHDNFFDIGGHSLLAMRVIVRMEKKLGARLNNAIMVLQTLEQVAAEIDKRTGRSEHVAGAAAAEATSSPEDTARSGAETRPAAAAEGAAGPDAEAPTGLSGRLLRAVRRRRGGS